MKNKSKSSKTKPSTKQVKKIVKSEIGKITELKYSITYQTAYGVGGIGASYITQLSGLPQGVTDTDRVGDKLTPVSLDLSYFWESPATNQTTYLARTILIRWKELNSTAIPTPAVMLQTIVSDRHAIMSTFNHDQRSRFNVLMDRVDVITPNAQYTGAYQPQDIKKYKKHFKLPNNKMAFVGGSSANQFNALYLVTFTCALNAGAVSGVPELNFYSKFSYRDD